MQSKALIPSSRKVVAMPPAITGMLDKLRDGKWHELLEIARNLSVSIQQVQEIAEFLVRHEHANFDYRRRRIKLKPDFLELL